MNEQKFPGQPSMGQWNWRDRWDRLRRRAPLYRRRAERWLHLHGRRVSHQFHNAVADFSQNRLLVGITQAIQKLIRYSMYGTDNDFKRNIDASFAGHVKIYEAIQRHDEAGARDAMSEHLLKSSRAKQ